MNIEIYDNGGRSYDRYCLIIDKKAVYTFPVQKLKSGVKYLCEAVDLDTKEAGTLINLKKITASKDLMRSLKLATALHEKSQEIIAY